MLLCWQLLFHIESEKNSFPETENINKQSYLYVPTEYSRLCANSIDIPDCGSSSDSNICGLVSMSACFHHLQEKENGIPNKSRGVSLQT